MRTFRKEDVVGKTVIDTSGSVRGKVEDVVFDLGGAITFVVRGEGGKQTEVAVARVTGISEHVIMKTEGHAEAFTPSTTCRYCGAAKAASAVWCPACGKSQA